MDGNHRSALRRRMWIVGGTAAVVVLVVAVGIATRDGDGDRVATDN